MKILVINSYYAPDLVGGAETATYLLAETLQKLGHQVLVFAGKNSDVSVVNGVTIYRCKTGFFDVKTRINGGNNLKKLINKYAELNNKVVANELEDVINQFHPDIAHVNNIYGLSPIIWKVLKGNNVPIVQTIHDYWLISDSNRFIKIPFLRNLKNFYIEKYANFVDIITAPSKKTLEIAENSKIFKGKKAYYVKNGIDFDINKTSQLIKEKFKRTSEKIKLLYVGSLENNKGIIEMLKCVEKSTNKNFELTICGDGKLRKDVENFCQIHANVKYLGKLSKEDVYREYSVADILLVPSVWEEPFGLVVIEAMFHGCVVLGSNRGGIAEIINDINSGILFEPKDIEKFKARLNYLLNRENIKKEMSKLEPHIFKYVIYNTTKEYEAIYSYIFNNQSNNI